jgi:D-alanine-D-alanine ligase
VPYVLEMNTIPGLTPTSLLPMSAKQSGLEFDDLVVEILKSAHLDYEG